MTRSQTKEIKLQEESAKYNFKHLLKANNDLPKNPAWNSCYLKISAAGTEALFTKHNLLDSHYSVKTDILFAKDEYMWMIGHFFRFEQLFRMIRWRIIREWLGSSRGNDCWDVNKEAFATLLRKSQYHYPIHQLK